MPAWPASLPPLGFLGAKVKAQDAVARSPMDQGPSSRRRKFTAVTKNLSQTMLLTGAQVATLETFFNDTLRGGSLAFDWTNPLDNSASSIAFLEPPEYDIRRGDADPNNQLWSTTMSLEIQP